LSKVIQSFPGKKKNEKLSKVFKSQKLWHI